MRLTKRDRAIITALECVDGWIGDYELGKLIGTPNWSVHTADKVGFKLWSEGLIDYDGSESRNGIVYFRRVAEDKS